MTPDVDSEGQDGRERLMQAGLEIFKRRALDDVSIGELARMAGVAHGLLSYHFGSKRLFYVEVIRRQVEEVDQRHRENTIAEPAAWLRKDVEIFLDNLNNNPRSPITFARTGYVNDPDMDALIDAFQDATMSRVLLHCQVSHPTSLLTAAIRGWFNFSREVGREWVLSDPPLEMTIVRDLLIDQLIAALESAARLDPAVDVDPALFRG